MDKSLLANATSSDDAPTPGYMLSDIARMTLVSIDTSQQVMEYLVQRLKKDNCNIKFKVLVVIRHICRTGRPEFKREMSRSTDHIKECLQYRGPPDELRGDEMYRRVREAAKETLDSVFDDHIPTPTTSMSSSTRIQGQGSGVHIYNSGNSDSAGSDDTYSSTISSMTSKVSSAMGAFSERVMGSQEYGNNPTSPPSTSRTGMIGISNPNYDDPRNEKSMLDRASEYWSKSKSESGSSSSSSSGYPLSIGGLGPGGYNGATNRGNVNNVSSESLSYVPVRPNISTTSNQRNVTTTSSSSTSSAYDVAKTERAFGWVKPREAGRSDYNQELNHEDQSSRSRNNNNNNAQEGRVGPGSSDGVYEQSIITALCAPGGTRPDPAHDLLVSFLQQARSLDTEIVGNLLTHQLNDNNWQIRAKALAVLNNLITTECCEQHREFWAVNFDVLHSLKNDGKLTVRDRATKVLHSLGLDGGQSTVPHVASSSSSSSSLLNAQQPQASHHGRSQNAQPRMNDDLLSGYTVTPQEIPVSRSTTTFSPPVRSQPVNEQKSDVFTSPITGNAGGGDLFAGLQPSDAVEMPVSQPVVATRSQRVPSNPTKPLPMTLSQGTSLISNAFSDEMLPPPITRDGRTRSSSRPNAPDHYFEGLLTSVPPPSMIDAMNDNGNLSNGQQQRSMASSELLTPISSFSPTKQPAANIDLSSFDPLSFNAKSVTLSQPTFQQQQPQQAVDPNAQMRQLHMQAMMIQQQMQQLMQQQPQQVNYPRMQQSGSGQMGSGMQSLPPTGSSNNTNSSGFSFLS